DRVMPPELERRGATRAIARLGRIDGPTHEIALLAVDEAGLGRGQRGARHRVPASPRRTCRGDCSASAHSMRSQALRRSAVIMIAAKSTTTAPIAYMPIPASTVARSAILIRATRMPRIITSF